MAWLSRINFVPTDKLFCDDLNNLGNDVRQWRGDVNGGGFRLTNVILDSSTSGGFVSSVFNRQGNVIAQAGDYTAAQVTNAVDTTKVGGYADPAWITSLSAAKLTGAPPSATIAATQTPWLQTINGAGYQLQNAGNIGIGCVSAITGLHIKGTYATVRWQSTNVSAGSPEGAWQWVPDSYAFYLQKNTSTTNQDFSTAWNYALFLPGGGLQINALPGSGASFLAMAGDNATSCEHRGMVNTGTNASTGTIFCGYMARGTGAAQALPKAGDYFAHLVGYGWTSGGWAGAAQISFQAEADWTSSAFPTSMRFFNSNGLERMRLSSAGNLGIGNNNPTAPLTFATTAGDKIALWGAVGGNYYGMAIQSNLFQIFCDIPGSRVGIGYGSSSSFTETLSVKGANVGIGVTNPASPLQIHVGTNQNFYFTTVSGKAWLYGLDDSGNSRTPLVIDASPICLMYGNVGIATTSPQYPLTVNGTATIMNPSAASPTILNLNNAASNIGYCYNQFAGTTFSGANYGAGLLIQGWMSRGTGATPLPIGANDSLLSLVGIGWADTWRTATQILCLPETAWSATVVNSMLGFWTTATLAGGPIERMRITSAGNVAIGVTSAASRLEVWTPTGQSMFQLHLASTDANSIYGYAGASGNASFVQFVRGNATTSATTSTVALGNGVPYQAVADDMVFSALTSGTWYERMRITNAGAVGIGITNPLAMLSTGTSVSPIKVASWDNGSGFAYGIGVAANQLTFGANINPNSGTPQMVLMNTGSLGIGTTSPQAMLQIGNCSSGGIGSIIVAGYGGGFRAFWMGYDASYNFNFGDYVGGSGPLTTAIS